MSELPMPGAKSFKAKRCEMYPQDQVQRSGPAPLDDSLTSLQWLQNFSIRSADPKPSSGPGWLRRLGTDSRSSSAAAIGMPLYLGSPFTFNSDSTIGPQFSRYPSVEVDYKTNPKVKPPYSYTFLICKAIQDSKQNKAPLSAIYEWVMENYCYYKNAETNWRNSIRHTLSLKKCFRKVPREKDEPGKGGFWQMDPEHSGGFINGDDIFKRKRLPTNHYSTQKRAKPFQLHQMVPEQKPLLAKNNVKKTRSTESPLLTCNPDSLMGDVLGTEFHDILSGTLVDSELSEAVVALEREMDVFQQPEGNVMNHQLSYGYMDLCATTMDGTGNIAELQNPLQYLYQYQDQQSGVEVGQPWAEVTVHETLDQGFGGSESFFTTPNDHSPQTTLTVL